MKKTVENVFQKIAERWFLTEPLLFATYCSHHMRANSNLSCVMRTGKGCIEYNPEQISRLKEQAVEEYLRAEMVRILLKHPYDRQPHGCSAAACTLGSECTLSTYYKIWKHTKLAEPSDYHLAEREYYEWYTYRIDEILKKSDSSSNIPNLKNISIPSIMLREKDSEDGEETSEGKGSSDGKGSSGGKGMSDGKGSSEGKGASEGKDSSNGNGKSEENGSSNGNGKPEENGSSNGMEMFWLYNTSYRDKTSEEDGYLKNQNQSKSSISEYFRIKSEQSALWNEDDSMQISINNIIENSPSWGTLPGFLVEQIVTSTKARVDYRKVLSGFRASCISTRRSLTRMRPNRRTGFQSMGSIYRYKTNILVAVDVSGSISSETLANFYTVINRFFHYGIENVDVVQFDCKMGEVKNIKKASRKVEVIGRGGTNFQCVIDFAQEAKCYDGVIIMTDGYAPHPVLPPLFRPRLLWICEDQDSFRIHQEWMGELGRVCTISFI